MSYIKEDKKVMKKPFCTLLFLFLFILTTSACAAPKTAALLMPGESYDGDNGFTDSCMSGAEYAQKRYHNKLGVKIYKLGENGKSPAELVRAAAASSELIISVTPEYNKLLAELRKSDKNKIITAFDHIEAEGIKEIYFRDDEGGFLAGALAAMAATSDNFPNMRKTGKIGLLLGADCPSIERFRTGYIAGSWYIDPEVEVITQYVGNFTDVAKASEIADTMHKMGAEVIFTAAGGAGLGAIERAEAGGYWIIGVDTEQEKKHPKAVLTSIIKRSGSAVFRTIDNYMKGTLQSMDYISLGLSEGGIDISTWNRESKNNIPLAIRNKLNDIEDKLANNLIIIKK